MYLSRVQIDTDNRYKIRDLTHVGAYHNWVEQSFPQEISEKKRTRKLWRIDQLQGKNYLLIVSSEQPDIELLESYGVYGSAQCKNYDPFLNSLKNGMRARFKVVLNPVISQMQEKGNRGRVFPYLSETEQLDFLMKRAEKNGFGLNEDDFYITENKFVLLKKSQQKDLRLIKVTYEGSLVIKNVEIFRKTLIMGFGKKKAYGFGMMTVIPIVNHQ